MFIKRLGIRNYRCFGDSPVIVELSESGLTALIGPNNVGKSTVLKALEVLLGDKWPSGQFNEDDFHENNLDKHIVLACEFNEPILIEAGKNEISVMGVVVFAQHLSTGFGENSVNVEYRLLESTGTLEDLDFERMDIATYRLSNGNRGDTAIFISQGIRNQLPIVITVPLIKLHSEQPMNKWSVLGRMLQKVEGAFTTDQAKVEDFRTKMKNAVGVLRSPQEFQDIETDVKDFWTKMKPGNLSGTSLEFLDFEPWRYYRQFKLAIRRHGYEVPIETLGEGVQRLAIIALYRAYLKRHGRNQRAILLVEEPESYLHPQARKTLFNVLRSAIKEDTEAEGQIIYTTHSEDFVDCGDFDDIVIFSEKEGVIEVRHITENALREHTLALDFVIGTVGNQHIHYRLIEVISQGLKEALFATKAIIVEGPSEAELFQFATDVDKDQTAIVIAGGKRNIPSIVAFLTAFGVPCLIVVDRDEKISGENLAIVKILTQAKATNPDVTKMQIDEKTINSAPDKDIFISNRLLVFSSNLEDVLGRKIPDFSLILSKLASLFGIPIDSKPRCMHALGLACRDTNNGDVDLEAKMVTARPLIAAVSQLLNEFAKQYLEKPLLLHHTKTSSSSPNIASEN